MFSLLKSGFQKIRQALKKTSSLLGTKLKALFSKPADEATYEELEQILYEADLGSSFIEYIKTFLRKKPTTTFEEIIFEMKKKALEILEEPPAPAITGTPHVILVVGVNGSGKTTSIAKLAAHYKSQNKKVLVAAGDTFRAAAIDQLAAWADRLKIDIVKGQPNGDPSAVVFDALTAAKARNADVVIIDTAGRLQNKTDLMKELEKIKRTASKVVPDSPHETLLVLDATTGQNAIDQAKTFNSFTPLSGIILAKLDGSAKGGIILSIYKDLKIPVKWVGVGEKEDDLLPFDKTAYIEGLFE